MMQVQLINEEFSRLASSNERPEVERRIYIGRQQSRRGFGRISICELRRKTDLRECLMHWRLGLACRYIDIFVPPKASSVSKAAWTGYSMMNSQDSQARMSDQRSSDQIWMPVGRYIMAKWRRMRPNMDAGGPVHNGEVATDESCFVETARLRVCPREGQYGIQVPLGAWHSVVVHEPSTILEAKDGAYGK